VEFSERHRRSHRYGSNANESDGFTGHVGGLTANGSEEVVVSTRKVTVSFQKVTAGAQEVAAGAQKVTACAQKVAATAQEVLSTVQDVTAIGEVSSIGE